MVLNNLYLFLLSPVVFGESIVFVQIFEFEFLVNIPVLVLPESKKLVFRVMSVSVCGNVCKTRGESVGPIFMKFGMEVIHGISKRFKIFLFLRVFYPPKPSKKIIKMINYKKWLQRY
jgi:hypothetical protein